MNFYIKVLTIQKGRNNFLLKKSLWTTSKALFIYLIINQSDNKNFKF